MRKPTIWGLSRSDTNRPVQSQEKARILSRRGIVLLSEAKTKALICFTITAKQLRNRSAPLFSSMPSICYLMRLLIS